MFRPRLYIAGLFLCVASTNIGVGADKVDHQHRDSHPEKDYIHHRAKRYVVGVPASYLYNQPVDDGYAMEKRYRSASMAGHTAASHFRELQQRKRPSPSVDANSVSPSQMQSYRNLMLYSGRKPIDDGDIDLSIPEDQNVPEVTRNSNSDNIGPLSDEELQALLLLLDQYRAEGKTSRNFYTPPAQYFTPMMGMPSPPKRETGKRTFAKGSLIMEQPMSFENSLGGDNYPVFISQKRSKRVGHPPLKSQKPLTRSKKQTDPGTDPELEKFFVAASVKSGQAENHASKQSTLTPTTLFSSSNQIPAPSNMKLKKSTDWSNYFGIDKRQNKEKPNEKVALLLAGKNKIPSESQPHPILKIKKVDSTTSMPTSGVTSSSGAQRDAKASTGVNGKTIERKEVGEKTSKADEDKKWILKEFYKTLAMSTNVKRKRESPASGNIDKLEKIEKKMEEAGDKIIWDTLKYTGAHKDEELSPSELAQIKSQIIGKLAAAYSLEKVREEIEDFRQQLKDKQHHY